MEQRQKKKQKRDKEKKKIDLKIMLKGNKRYQKHQNKWVFPSPLLLYRVFFSNLKIGFDP